MRAALRRSALMLVCVVAAPLSAQTLAANTQPESPAWMATSPRLTSDSTARPKTDGAPATPSPLVATRSWRGPTIRPCSHRTPTWVKRAR